MNTDDLYAQIERLFFENQQLRQERAAAFRQSDEYMAERDRARATAVAFEQQLARIEAEMAALERQYREALDFRWSSEKDAAMDAVYDCFTSVEVVTDVLGNDQYAETFGGSNADPS